MEKRKKRAGNREDNVTFLQLEQIIFLGRTIFHPLLNGKINFA